VTRYSLGRNSSGSADRPSISAGMDYQFCSRSVGLHLQLPCRKRRPTRFTHESHAISCVWHRQLSCDEFVRLVKSRHWVFGACIGVTVGLSLACITSFLDWRLNPDGIFHDAESTNWAIVWETAASWFLPFTASVSVLAWLGLYIFSRRS